jgi:hypothetical protein
MAKVERRIADDGGEAPVARRFGGELIAET